MTETVIILPRISINVLVYVDVPISYFCYNLWPSKQINKIWSRICVLVRKHRELDSLTKRLMQANTQKWQNITAEGEIMT